MPRTFFKRIPNLHFRGKVGNLGVNKFFGPARRFLPVRELGEDKCCHADGGFSRTVKNFNFAVLVKDKYVKMNEAVNPILFKII
jgi:hypothetical protein